MIIIVLLIYTVSFKPFFTIQANRIIEINELTTKKLELNQKEVAKLNWAIGKPALMKPTFSKIKSTFFIRIEFYNNNKLLQVIYATEGTRNIVRLNKEHGLYCSLKTNFYRALNKIFDDYNFELQ